MNYPQAQWPFKRVTPFLGNLRDLARFIEGQFGLFNHAQTNGGWAHKALATLEQMNPEFIFQACNGHA